MNEPTIHRWSVDEIRALPSRHWNIDGLLAEGDIATMHGPSGIGKSHFSVMLSGLLASGSNWFKRLNAPRKHKVGYMPTEGTKHDFKEQLKTVDAMGWDVKGQLDIFQIAPLNLTRPTDPSVVKGVMPMIEELDLDILFIDSLYSSVQGSLSEDGTASQLMATLKYIQAVREPKPLSIVLVHHDHRTRRDQQGKEIDEGSESFHGSGFIKNMSAQMWQYKRQNGSVLFVPGKQRAHESESASFYVLWDKETGMITPSDSSEASKQHALEKWCRKAGVFSKQDAVKGNQFNMSASLVEKGLKSMVEKDMLRKLQHGRYEWIPGRSTLGPPTAS